MFTPIDAFMPVLVHILFGAEQLIAVICINGGRVNWRMGYTVVCWMEENNVQ